MAGPEAGVYDATHGSFTHFSNDAHKRESGVFSQPTDVVVNDFALNDDGNIVGYLGRASFSLHRDGAVEHPAYDFTARVSAGANGVAVDRNGRLWQSRDYGQSWHEVQGPPGASAKRRPRPERCSRVGCSFGPWLRIGFPDTSPRASELSEAPAPPASVSPALPRLSCTATAPPKTRWVTRARNAAGGLIEEFDFGARKFHVREEGAASAATWAVPGTLDSSPRAATILETELVSMTMPRFASLVSQPRVVRFSEFLGPTAVVESRFTWQDVLRAGAHAGEPEAPASDRKSAAPVLSSQVGASDGLLLETNLAGVLLWARANKPARVLDPEVPGTEPLAAQVRGKDELVALLESDDCAARVVVSDSAGTRSVLELPRRASRRSCPVNNDALAVGADGSLAVLRLPSREPATKDDPALVLRPGQQPLALAPWSTLEALDACPKDFAGWRALVHVGPWLALTLPGVEVTEKTDLFAAVRWSETALCVEAIEMDAGALVLNNEEIATRLFARFTGQPMASRRGFALGAEHDQPLSCKLEH